MSEEQQTADSYIKELEQRVKKLEEAIEKHRMDMWGKMYQVDNCIDEELYKTKDKI